MGRQLGVLRGTVNALLGSLQQSKNLTTLESRDITFNDLQNLSQRLARIRLKDIAPRDLQAEAHAREHLDVEAEGTDDALAKAIMELETADRPNGADELASIQHEIHTILQKLGINVSF